MTEKSNENMEREGIPENDEPKSEEIANSSSAHENVSETEELKRALEEKEKEAADYKERWLRALADYDNFKKRTQKEIQDIYLYAGEQLIKDILPILDNFERALNSVEDTESATYEGVKLIYNQMKNVLNKFGVREIEAEGKPFDPHFHEVIMTVESDKYESDTVVEVLQKGYTYHSKVIRPCLVKVAKK
ncbi:nucleotide exchange factor GrpE [Thermosediminibacter litoriperuensis]|uniref:Protein GrpE n=1 Tax=Thermosediminibacter litoriperuensis TaxID=291989 RepID=A0A5S5ASZ9_9FIRM|nr:nucleotide exchange factor GrpE [Thermosediminibacter litoriperuensis]TYP54985.1 molecular chaperone GrpE [Thermosediminibacter litoriperuensis]